MIDIFVSYSRKDREIVKRLVDVLRGRGWSVWWDPTIRPGEYYEDVIEQALTESKCVVVVWSKNSVASKWVRAEAAEAANRGVLVPVVIDDAKIPFRFKQIQEARLVDWQFTTDHPELVRLLESITESLTRAEIAPADRSTNDSRETEERSAHEAEAPPTTRRHPSSEIETSADRAANRNDFDLEDSGQEKHSVDDPARRARPYPPAGTHFNRVASARPPLKSKRGLTVVAIAIMFGLIAAGAIYFFAIRRSASAGDPINMGTAQPNKVTNQQLNVNGTQVAPKASPAVSPTASPTADPVYARKIAGLLKGQWQSQNVTASTECACGHMGCLDIQFGKTISDFCVESNQVYVSVAFRLDAPNNRAYLFFKEPTDLGAGGARMPWDKFDRKRPLATIDLSDLEAQRIIYVTWHGFTEAGAAPQKWRQFGSGYQGTYSKR